MVVLGVPAAIWALLNLHEQKVIAAFSAREVRHDPVLARRRREMAPARVRMLADWLLVTAVFTCLSGISCLFLGSLGHGNSVFLFSAGLVALVQGLALIVCYPKMSKLASYEFALCGCIIAMLPLSPAALLGLPAGIYILAALRRPEVVEAFEAERAKHLG